MICMCESGEGGRGVNCPRERVCVYGRGGGGGGVSSRACAYECVCMWGGDPRAVHACGYVT